MRDIVSNHQLHDCFLNRLFRRRSKKTSKLRVTGLCVGNSPGTGEFPTQMASYAENVSIWWRHHCSCLNDTSPYKYQLGQGEPGGKILKRIDQHYLTHWDRIKLGAIMETILYSVFFLKYCSFYILHWNLFLAIRLKVNVHSLSEGSCTEHEGTQHDIWKQITDLFTFSFYTRLECLFDKYIVIDNYLHSSISDWLH